MFVRTGAASSAGANFASAMYQARESRTGFILQGDPKAVHVNK